MTAEIILAAAGESRRMGRWKPGVLLNHEPLLFHALKAALQTPWPVILVGGYRFSDLEELTEDFFSSRPFARNRFKLIENPDYTKGPATTFLRGIEETTSEWLFFSLADLPYITAETYQELFVKRSPPGCRPVFGDVPGHPVLVSNTIFPDILKRYKHYLEQPSPGELAMKNLTGPLRTIEWADKAVIRDIDSVRELPDSSPLSC